MQVNIASLRQSGKLRTSETYRASLNSFRKFMDGKDVLVSNMDAELMMGYETYLKEQGASMNTVSYYMRILRATSVSYTHLLVSAYSRVYKSKLGRRQKSCRLSRRPGNVRPVSYTHL